MRNNRIVSGEMASSELIRIRQLLRDSTPLVDAADDGLLPYLRDCDNILNYVIDQLDELDGHPFFPANRKK